MFRPEGLQRFVPDLRGWNDVLSQSTVLCEMIDITTDTWSRGHEPYRITLGNVPIEHLPLSALSVPAHPPPHSWKLLSYSCTHLQWRVYRSFPVGWTGFSFTQWKWDSVNSIHELHTLCTGHNIKGCFGSGHKDRHTSSPRIPNGKCI